MKGNVMTNLPYTVEAENNGAKLAEQICNQINVLNAEKEWVKGFVETFDKQHRTLQASAVRVLIKALKKYGSEGIKNKRYDGRNEAAVDYCAELEDPVIPFV